MGGQHSLPHALVRAAALRERRERLPLAALRLRRRRLAGPARRDVLAGIENTTQWIEEGYSGEEEVLKFLIHFVGDVHQPLHLAGRDKGGNGARVRWDGRITSQFFIILSYLFRPRVLMRTIFCRPTLRLGLVFNCQVAPDAP